MPGPRLRARAPIAAAVLTLGLAGCLDVFAPDCDDCPSDAHWGYRCIGWIAPDCGTYCLSGDRLLDDCCCDGKDLGKAAPANAPWRPLKMRAQTKRPGPAPPSDAPRTGDALPHTAPIGAAVKFRDSTGKGTGSPNWATMSYGNAADVRRTLAA